MCLTVTEGKRRGCWKRDERAKKKSVSNGLSQGQKSLKIAKAKRCQNPKRWTPKVQKERKREKEKTRLRRGKRGGDVGKEMKRHKKDMSRMVCWRGESL